MLTEVLEKLYTAFAAERFLSNFPKALILSCVCDFCSDDFKNKLSTDLLNAITKQGSVNYWINSEQGGLPDDLDDTFCAYAALYKTNPDFISGETLAKISQLLIFNESTVGGPYYTWLMSGKSTNDVDPIVNANILYFLSQLQVETPNVTQYLIDCVRSDKFCSPYYCGVIPAMFFLSRLNVIGLRDELAERYIAYLNSVALQDLTVLEISLLMSICLNLQSYIPGELSANFLDELFGVFATSLASARECVSATSLASARECVRPLEDCHIVIERVNLGTNHYLTSYSVTLAFIAQAIHAYESYLAKPPGVQHLDIDFKKRLLEELREFPISIRQKVLDVYYPQAMSPSLISPMLAMGNNLGNITDIIYDFVLGWICYSIYDDIYDEAENIFVLPAMVYLLRLVCQKHANYNMQIFDQIDVANATESAYSGKDHTSYDFSLLYKKSFGYVLPFLRIIEGLGFDQESLQARHIIEFFKNFLTVKQLNDDAHDWEEDYKNNRTTFPISLLHKYAGDTQTIESLRETFWVDAIPVLSAILEKHITFANEALSSLQETVNITPLKHMLATQKFAIQKALDERRLVLDFLATYSIIK